MLDFKFLLSSLIVVFFCNHVTAQESSSIGPMTIGSFRSLQQKLVGSESANFAYFSNPTHASTVNVLVEGLLGYGGAKFCIPEAFNNFSIGRIFTEVASVIPESVRKHDSESYI